MMLSYHYMLIDVDDIPVSPFVPKGKVTPVLPVQISQQCFTLCSRWKGNNRVDYFNYDDV